MDKDPFSYFKFGQTTDANMRGTISSAYQLFMAIGAIGLLVSIIVIGITLATAPPAKRAEALEEAKWKVISGIVLFAIATIIGWILKIAGSFT